MAELLPCPFCGSTADLRSAEGDKPGEWTHAVDCTGDGCGGGVELFSDRSEAVAAWNRRTETSGDTMARVDSWMRNDPVPHPEDPRA